MEDELREPQLRNKLQREVIFLKKTNGSLTKQIEALKRTNEALQRSTKTFLDNNQQVISKWEQEYEAIIGKMGALTKINDDLKEEKAHQEGRN
jgi:FtsZ-binding cell division protein ZapB